MDDLRPDDFASLRATLASQYGPVRLGNEVQKVPTVFMHGAENGLVEKAVRFGSEFKKPTRKVMRQHKAKAGKKRFAADDIRRLLAAAGVPMRAMILLGINAAFGNADCGTLRLSALDLDRRVGDVAAAEDGRRAAGGAVAGDGRRRPGRAGCPPGPERRGGPGLVFVTQFGRSRMAAGTSWAVAQEFGKLLARIGVARRGVAFYRRRHTIRTAADATKDANAIRTVTGHTDESIDASYTHGFGDPARWTPVLDDPAAVWRPVARPDGTRVRVVVFRTRYDSYGSAVAGRGETCRPPGWHLTRAAATAAAFDGLARPNRQEGRATTTKPETAPNGPADPGGLPARQEAAAVALAAGATLADAADTLGFLARKGRQEGIRLAAARAVLELGVKLRDAVEFEQRIAALEAARGTHPPARRRTARWVCGSGWPGWRRHPRRTTTARGWTGRRHTPGCRSSGARTTSDLTTSRTPTRA